MDLNKQQPSVNFTIEPNLPTLATPFQKNWMFFREESGSKVEKTFLLVFQPIYGWFFFSAVIDCLGESVGCVWRCVTSNVSVTYFTVSYMNQD